MGFGFRRSTAILALLAWVLAFICSVPALAHACCKDADSKASMQPMAPCCVVQPAAAPATLKTTALGGPDDLPTLPARPNFHLNELLSLAAQDNVSVQALQYVADVSRRRCVEFGVLLN